MYILFFILGLIIGSFLNVVIFRLNKKSLKGRSHCIFCKKKLHWHELIPLFSFFLLKGKCKKCKKKISIQYPLVEFFTGLIFVLISLKTFNLDIFSILITFFWFIFASFLIVIFVYDLKHYLVADKVIYPAIFIALIYILFLFLFSNGLFPSLVFSYLVSGLIGGGFFLIIVLISKEKWMGMGDVKIGVFIGLILGIQLLLVALFLAFVIGAIISLILIFLNKKGLKSEIPFGPFLTGACLTSFLWGDFLLNWYFNLFL
ncbi:prepilin peptidase [Patescibacteria group bacterium]|nr:prepilin peptidase [Patescibacteria group bacterium]